MNGAFRDKDAAWPSLRRSMLGQSAAAVALAVVDCLGMLGESGHCEVEVAGIEPASFNVSVSLLRAQSLRDCRATAGSDTLHVSVAVCACPCRPVGTGGRRALQMMAPTPAGRGQSGRTHNLRSGCEHQIVLIDVGVCIFFRLFFVDPETTARFSHFNRQSRNRSPPWWLRNPRCAGSLGGLQP